MTAPATAPAPAANGNGKSAPKVVLKPFRVGVTDIDDEPYDVTVTLGAGAVTLTPQYEIPSSGYLNDVYILVENTVTSSTATATGTAAVGVLKEDGPYCAIGNITFTDTSSSEVVGPMTGWDLYVIDKFGGYMFQDDPEANTDLFTATTNATASSSASGSFSFMLRIPIQLVPRDALGTLPNKSSSTPYKVKTQMAAIADIYQSSSTVGGSCRVRMIPASYWEPTKTDGSGHPIAQNPPGVHTTQYWIKSDYTVSSGSNTVPLTNSVGYPVRNLLFINRDDALSRATGETEFPDPFRLQLQSNMVLDRPKKYWKRRVTEDYGYGATGETVGLKDSGVYPLPFCRDFAHKPGWETRRGYLRTTDGMKLQAKGSWGGAGTFTVLTNFIGVGPGTSLSALTT